MTLTPEPLAWTVFHVWMEATRPAAKFKFFVALHHQGGSALGILINSRINELGQGPRLLPCFAPLAAAEHTFLDYDSWADCTGTFTLPHHLLTDQRGSLIRTPIEPRMKYGFDPTNGSRREYGFCGMDAQAALSRLCGNLAESVSALARR